MALDLSFKLTPKLTSGFNRIDYRILPRIEFAFKLTLVCAGEVTKFYIIYLLVVEIDRLFVSRGARDTSIVGLMRAMV